MRSVVRAGYRLIARPAVSATPPVQRKAVGLSVKAVRAIWAIRTVGSVAALPLLRRLLRLSAGDEGRQPFDVLLALLQEVRRAFLISPYMYRRLPWPLPRALEGLEPLLPRQLQCRLFWALTAV